MGITAFSFSPPHSYSLLDCVLRRVLFPTTLLSAYHFAGSSLTILLCAYRPFDLPDLHIPLLILFASYGEDGNGGNGGNDGSCASTPRYLGSLVFLCFVCVVRRKGFGDFTDLGALGVVVLYLFTSLADEGVSERSCSHSLINFRLAVLRFVTSGS